MQSRPVLQARPPAARLSRPDQDERMSDEEAFEDAVDMADTIKPHPLPVSQQLAATMGVHAHRVQVMKASFFGTEEPPQHTHYEQTPPLQLQRHSLFRGSLQCTTPLIQTQTTPIQTTPLAQRALDISHTPQMTALQAQSAVLLEKHDLRTIVPLKESLVAKRERHIADLGLFMGRSFRVGWGPNWTLSHSGLQLSHSQTRVGGSLFSGYTHTVAESQGLPVRAVLERVKVFGTNKESFVSDHTPYVWLECPNWF